MESILCPCPHAAEHSAQTKCSIHYVCKDFLTTGWYFFDVLPRGWHFFPGLGQPEPAPLKGHFNYAILSVIWPALSKDKILGGVK